MILQEETLKKLGYDCKTLTTGSLKRVLVKCDYCGEETNKSFAYYLRQRESFPKDSCFKCASYKQKEIRYKKYEKSGQVPSHSRMPPKIGEKFNTLTVIGETYYIDYNYCKKPFVRCKCDCGKEIECSVVGLRSKARKSCGCLATDSRTKASTTHGFHKTKLYKVWHGIKQRCYNPKTIKYNNYGGKGISICNEWLVFINFRIWCLSNGYSEEAKDLAIDRIDANGNYEPSNCRIVTKSQNSINVTLERDNKIKRLETENERLKSILTANNIQF